MSSSSTLLPGQHPLTDSERWKALTTRDSAFASSFVYAVTTTKIYCRPNCPSRLARRANVIFFSTATAAAADKSGFRPCKRCKPDQPLDDQGNKANLLGGVEKVNRAMAIILQSNARAMPIMPEIQNGKDASTTTATIMTTKSKKSGISLGDLAREVGLSKWHLQREFKRRMGISPREMEERVRGVRKQGNGTNEELQPRLQQQLMMNTAATTDTWLMPRSETAENLWEAPVLSTNDPAALLRPLLQQQQQDSFDLNWDSDFDFNLYYAPTPPVVCTSKINENTPDNLGLEEGIGVAPSASISPSTSLSISAFGDVAEVERKRGRKQFSAFSSLSMKSQTHTRSSSL